MIQVRDEAAHRDAFNGSRRKTPWWHYRVSPERIAQPAARKGCARARGREDPKLADDKRLLVLKTQPVCGDPVRPERLFEPHVRDEYGAGAGRERPPQCLRL
jgi:hypothetical protein